MGDYNSTPIMSGFEVLFSSSRRVLRCKLPEMRSFSFSFRETFETLVAVKVYDLILTPSGITCLTKFGLSFLAVPPAPIPPPTCSAFICSATALLLPPWPLICCYCCAAIEKAD